MSGRAGAGPSRASLFAALALAAAMVLGGAVGFALGRRYARPGPGGGEMTLLGVSRSTLLDSLDLSREQRARMDELLTDAERRANAAVDALVKDVRDITDASRREVRALLDERQRARFDSILSTALPTRPRTPVPRPPGG